MARRGAVATRQNLYVSKGGLKKGFSSCRGHPVHIAFPLGSRTYITSMFANTVQSLTPDDRKLLTEQLGLWRNGACDKSKRVACNIDAETALGIDDFLALLQDFCTELRNDPAEPVSGWEAACRRHKFKGKPVPNPAPTRLGRALPIQQYAKLLAPKVGLSDAKAEEMIRKVALSGSTPGPRETRLLRRTPVGRFLIWATFRENKPDGDPFGHLPKNTEAVRTALGLGECPETETLILINWKREGALATLSIHRPTVADAEMYSWYRPVQNAAAPWGFTEPLAPNLQNFSPCPEVVHEVVTGETLVFPVHLVL